MTNPNVIPFPGKYYLENEESQAKNGTDNNAIPIKNEKISMPDYTSHKKDCSVNIEMKPLEFPKIEVTSLEDFLDNKEAIENTHKEQAFMFNDLILNYASLDCKTQRYVSDYQKLKPLFEGYEFMSSFGGFDPEQIRKHLITFYEEYFHDLARDGFMYQIFRPMFKPLYKMKRTVFNVEAYCGHMIEKHLISVEDELCQNYLHILNLIEDKKDIRIKNLKKYISQELRLMKKYFHD